MLSTMKKMLATSCLLLSSSVFATQEMSGVIINGNRLNVLQLQAVEMHLGYKIMPGTYLLNFQNGCWLEVNRNDRGCIAYQNSGVHSRYGSGERSSDGSWSHYSNAAGMGVGGTADGCVYTANWSNC